MQRATLVGQNLRVRASPSARGCRCGPSRVTTSASCWLVAAIFYGVSESLVGLFAHDADVIAYGSDCLRYVSYGYGFFGVSLVLTQAFNGAGDTYTPTWINFICFWLVQLPVAYALAEWRAMGPQGVFVRDHAGRSTGRAAGLVAVPARTVAIHGGLVQRTNVRRGSPKPAASSSPDLRPHPSYALGPSYRQDRASAVGTDQNPAVGAGRNDR
jgi:hypothetical protein